MVDVSVIVLTYNQEDTISRALDSILSQQTSISYEIILANDCSSDKTDEICREYQKRFPSKIKYINREKNLGIVGNYYDCVRQATGKYITDCSGDDLWESKNKLQEQFEILEREGDVSLVSGQWIINDTQRNEITKSKEVLAPGKYDGKDLLFPLFINKWVVNLSASMYRSRIIKNILQDNPGIMEGKGYRFEDLQIVLACAASGNIVVTEDTVLTYCVGHKSVSHQQHYGSIFDYTYNSLLQRKKLQEYFIGDLSKNEERALKEYYKEKYDFLMSMAFKAGPSGVPLEELNNLRHKDLGIKGRVYRVLMYNNLVWRIVLGLIK